jgi:hypothetical protein
MTMEFRGSLGCIFKAYFSKIENLEEMGTFLMYPPKLNKEDEVSLNLFYEVSIPCYQNKIRTG